MTDVLDSAILYDTMCDKNNVTELLPTEDKIITHRNITNRGDMFQMLYRKFDNSGIPFDYDENRGYDRNFERLDILNEVISEEYNNLDQIPINNCVSYAVHQNLANPTSVLSTVTEAISKIDVTNVKTLVAIVNNEKSGNNVATIWELSINEGQLTVNKLSSAVLSNEKNKY